MVDILKQNKTKILVTTFDATLGEVQNLFFSHFFVQTVQKYNNSWSLDCLIHAWKKIGQGRIAKVIHPKYIL